VDDVRKIPISLTAADCDNDLTKIKKAITLQRSSESQSVVELILVKPSSGKPGLQPNKLRYEVGNINFIGLHLNVFYAWFVPNG
jgi:hypothetical protein